MVLIVITYIQVDGIKNSVITFGFLVTMSQKMLLNPSGSQWMQANRKEKTGNQINRGPKPEKINKKPHEGKLDKHIDYRPFIHKRNFFQPHGSYHLKQGIEQ